MKPLWCVGQVRARSARYGSKALGEAEIPEPTRRVVAGIVGIDGLVGYGRVTIEGEPARLGRGPQLAHEMLRVGAYRETCDLLGGSLGGDSVMAKTIGWLHLRSTASIARLRNARPGWGFNRRTA